MTSWQARAAALAADIAGPGSGWHDAVRSVPRHVLIPRWFTQSQDGQVWEVRDGPSDEPAWLDAAYDARMTLVTRIGAVHAGEGQVGDVLLGRALLGQGGCLGCSQIALFARPARRPEYGTSG